MTSSSSSALLLALLANLALSTAGCGVFGSGDAEKAADSDTALPERVEGKEGALPKAPPVGAGPTDPSELTNELGVFVSPSGAENADGSLEHPVASIQAGIDLGKKAGKRVYVCTGTYREALTIADSISVIGGLDCSGEKWRTGAPRTRLEAPTSPAVRAADIISPTRLDNLDIVAPDATAPSASSIGMVITHAKALVISGSKISAGNAANGVDGTEGTQLVTSATATGGYSTNAGSCNDVGRCEYNQGWINLAVVAQGGTNQCEGAPGHAAESGGRGGEGGLWQVIERANSYFEVYRDDHYLATMGVKSLSSAAGADAPDAANAAPLGTFGPEGYAPSNGTPGSDGAPGKGGNGGDGRRPDPTLNPATNPGVRGVWRGFGGAGGGAGGCPGLAGTPGTGGGASIAAIVIDSTTTFENSELSAGRGGDGGKGTFGSMPTAGGAAGFALTINDGNAFLLGQPGGRGGAAGVSGNGSSGPSLGIAHVGTAPTLAGTTKVTAAAGGNAIDERSRTDAFGVSKTIPAMPAGISKDILAL